MPRALLSWLAAGLVLPEDIDSPGEIKAGVETVEDTKTKAKSKNSRARRLSYVANAEGVGPQVQSLSCLLARARCFSLHNGVAKHHCTSSTSLLLQPALGGESSPAADKSKAAPVNVAASSASPSSSDKPRAPSQSSNTRARRLSYVTNDVSTSHLLTCHVADHALYVIVIHYGFIHVL